MTSSSPSKDSSGPTSPEEGQTPSSSPPPESPSNANPVSDDYAPLYKPGRGRKTAAKKKEVTAAQMRDARKSMMLVLEKVTALSNQISDESSVLGHVGRNFEGESLGKLKMAKQPKILTGGILKSHQREALTWMYQIARQAISGILADEMGLGKTISTISFVARLREVDSYYGPFLIAAPLSTLSNWMAEFAKWAPTIPVVLFHGDPKERKVIFETQVAKHLKKNHATEQFPVICTSYEMVLNEINRLKTIPFEIIVIDEGHRLKNSESKLYLALQELMTRDQSRFLLTGTPLQNNMKELWSMLHFCWPNAFKNWDNFQHLFDFSDLQDDKTTEQFLQNEEKQEIVSMMHRILQPMMLRRVKADVLKDLPPKREYVLYAPLTDEQTTLYKVLTDNTQDTREYLRNKLFDRLTSASTTPSASRSSSRASSLNRKVAVEKNEPKAKAKQTELPVRTSPRKSSEQQKNAFSMMMSAPKSKPEPKPVVATPATKGTKRKESPASEPTSAKVAKSSRSSTPATTQRGRSIRNDRNLQDADSDDDQLDDDAFEERLAKQLAVEKPEELAENLSEADLERAETFELAVKHIKAKNLGNPEMQLRLVCNTPHLFYNPWAVGKDLAIDESIVDASGKMRLLDRLLTSLIERGHKVLIFSQFKTQIELLHSYCEELRGWRVCRIDGAVSLDDRREQIETFNSDPDAKVFLLSTKAGGQGINLSSADTVILFDSDWNPQTDRQAQDRCHRIGQKRPVIVYRFATKGTVEENMLRTAAYKLRLTKLVIKKGGLFNLRQAPGKADKNALDQLLLKEGEVYHVPDHGELLTDADLDILCDRRPEAYAQAENADDTAQRFEIVDEPDGQDTSAGL